MCAVGKHSRTHVLTSCRHVPPSRTKCAHAALACEDKRTGEVGTSATRRRTRHAFHLHYCRRTLNFTAVAPLLLP
jgi:hypothetical protein